MASSAPLPAWLMVLAASGGLALTWGIAYSLYLDNKRQKSWLRTDAKVTRSGVVRAAARSGTLTRYRPEVLYTYYLNGRHYESEAIGSGAVTYASQSAAQQEADKYPAGAGLIVYVDPDHPESAVLEPGHAWWAIALPFLIGLAWASAWLAAWYSAHLAPWLRRHG